ncbi:TrmH family RNA methyltransferase [Draconibacterium sp.]|nr:TrmH family RNA methyltransferase [Draconibacterium sp.]
MNTNSVDFFNNHEILPLQQNLELIIAVWSIGNPENIGQIIRLAHNVGAKKVLFVNDKINFRESKIKKTAGFSYEQMDWEIISISDFHNLLNKDYKLVVLETCDESKSIYSTNFPDKIILLAGSESHGIPSEVISESDLSVHIPMPGGCKSMNVSHAVSVAAFEWYRQKVR